MNAARAFRNICFFCLGMALAASAMLASAAPTGFQFDNRCHETSALALEAFMMKFQAIQTGGDYELCGGAYAPAVVANTSYTGQSAATAIKYYTSNYAPMTGDSCATAYPRWMGLPACDPETQGIAFSGTNALFLVLAFFYAAMLGFKTGYRT